MSRGQLVVVVALGSIVAVVFLVVVVVVVSGGDEPSQGAAQLTSTPTPPTTVPPATAPPTTTTPPTTTPPPTTPPTTTPPTTATQPPSTTTTLAPTTTTTPATTLAAGDPLVLIPGGFQTVPFGVEPDVAIGRVALAFGEPTDDTGWLPSQDLGPCPGEFVRLVSWGELSVLFTDEVTPFAVPGARHFTSWLYTGPAAPTDAGLRTATGIGLGSSRADLEAAYGERLNVIEDDLFGPSFRVDFEPDTDDVLYLSGALSDAGPAGVVIGLAGGRGCGE